MANTIEILESIGADARLRYAKPDVLNRTLRDVKASKTFMQAATGGDKALLISEFERHTRKNNLRRDWDPATPQIINAVWREET